MNFYSCLSFVLDHEDGYVNDPDDPGGETKYGISKRSYPKKNISELTKQSATAIYFRDYWIPSQAPHLPHEVRLPYFDMCVNAGVDRSAKIFQETVGTKQDGVVGPVTLMAAEKVPNIAFKFTTERMLYYSNLSSTFKKFGRGWYRRSLRALLKAHSVPMQ